MNGNLSQTPDFYQSIRSILIEARKKAYASLNHLMIEAYWKVGCRIVEEEQGGQAKAAYGERVLKGLSKALSEEFGKGFSYANLRNFRQFYLTYPDFEKCYTLCSKLSWSHNRLIMRIDDEKARAYYLQEASEQNWSVRQLERQIKTKTYQRLLSSASPSKGEVTLDLGSRPRQLLKDPYVPLCACSMI